MENIDPKDVQTLIQGIVDLKDALDNMNNENRMNALEHIGRSTDFVREILDINLPVLAWLRTETGLFIDSEEEWY
jgi:hypothetical protein